MGNFRVMVWGTRGWMGRSAESVAEAGGGKD